MPVRSRGGESRPRPVLRALALLLCLAILAGCGGGGKPPAGGYHPAGWLTAHPAQALAGLDHCRTCHETTVLKAGSGIPGCMTSACHHGTLPGFGLPAAHGVRAKAAQDATGGGLVSCQACHGADFGGGGSAVSCKSCHGVAAPHPPRPWNGLATHSTTDPSNAAVCARCHFAGAPANPAGHPAQPAPAGTVPTCYNNTLCHGANTASHPVPFLGPLHAGATQAAFTAGCATCHALDGASPVASAPQCSACHQAGSPLTRTGCASCHGKPPAGSAFPDVKGAHARHDALGGVTGTCTPCHTSYDAGSLAHYNRGNARPGLDSLRVPPGAVQVPAAFNAKAGPAAFDRAALTCSNVSCHGGAITPAWGTGTLDSASDAGCRQCHAAGGAESNAAATPLHAFHLGAPVGALCTDCHAMANGTPGALNHFAHLDTPQMEGPAGDTIQYAGNRSVYNAANRSCTLTCHGYQHAGSTWASPAGTYHATGWLAVHPGQALAPQATCTVCHAMTVPAAPSAIPSCMTAACHHGTITGYNLAATHGPRAKALQGPGGGGLRSCQACHGPTFAGGASTVSCQSCHGVPAPHAPRPWNDAAGLTHSTTDPSNAAVCAQCHLAGSSSNPPGHPAQPAPAGTVPTCFNNTMCHGPEDAPHPLGAGWRDATSTAFHGLAAKKDLLACQACHGIPGTPGFAGGSAPTSCAACHAAASSHSTTWAPAPVETFPGYVPSHRDAQNRDNACPVCHDYAKGRTAPLPAAPSCFASAAGAVACHAAGPGQPNHAVPFLGALHTGATPASFASDCGTCHVVTGTPPLASAPACVLCHQAGSPLALAACASCHGKPPAGGAFPDLAGSHAKHDALARVTGLCSTCHDTFDAGSQAHYDRGNARPGLNTLRVPPAPVRLLATFNAKAGAAAMNASNLTCSNVSCHGGVTTPAWGTGTIAATTDGGCRQCHQVGSAQATPENNAAWSGLHGFHLASVVGALCTDCHSMTGGTAGAANHFAHLDTPQMEGPAGDTILLPGSSANAYDAANRTCTVTCHGHAHAASSWNGGPSHPVPYLGTGHTGANSQAAFASGCASCHGVTGASPLSTAPLCTVCHQAGSPLAVANCASCHARPPAGAAFPDLPGRHAKHNALPSVTGQCGSCHTNYDAGTLNHYTHANARPGADALRVPPAPTGFSATYNAKAGAASFSPTAYTCTSVSCHGALAAPSWQTGTLDSTGATGDAGCRACHARGTSLGVPENNSYYSGHHGTHLGSEVSAKCTDCHGMANGTPGALAHFTRLDTPQMEGPASDTIQYLGSRTVYNATSRTCTLTCHGENHTNRGW
ncbi:hypothetical protein [Geothrix sp. 21YS21S-2]|uniref:CxxxxCH/CxxCH domain c-type cytochrome n=1 Tax=Geothrix sp. 21YS21S-2 TaxID=3068893 RepID=UPI0027BAD595|nr:hypothetical protein [Geothrix sp. 21YS21S-2]